MIAVDTSALIAILKGEPEAAALARAIDRADRILFGAPSLLEARIVARQQRPPVDDLLDELLLDIGAEIVDFTAAHVDAATDAFLSYGKGRHPAALNYGDCMAYAIARVAGCPLLYKGEDFARTDVRRAG
ncbi:type II toxin-antitoxin system VapC family toxin [Sphingomonas corticis]|uniref:Ribonuclease VapC n=1 Tax=Sphingomonas corticis TaxID=2722791 RepID=A0ABX1CMB0_9SPHN|nr:type II toxin-antitoxin system VapC family toxin [Sphingomonas corticis]NJR79125.1 type II toxin-antitoxin system VapC family toxin [Sphingomonas corticis]